MLTSGMSSLTSIRIRNSHSPRASLSSQLHLAPSLIGAGSSQPTRELQEPRATLPRRRAREASTRGPISLCQTRRSSAVISHPSHWPKGIPKTQGTSAFCHVPKGESSSSSTTVAPPNTTAISKPQSTSNPGLRWHQLKVVVVPTSTRACVQLQYVAKEIPLPSLLNAECSQQTLTFALQHRKGHWCWTKDEIESLKHQASLNRDWSAISKVSQLVSFLSALVPISTIRDQICPDPKR